MQITPSNSHALCTWPLHVTLHRDPCTWPYPVTPGRGPGAALLAELSWLNTSSRFRRKHNFFGVPKICSVSTWRITWLLPFTLSIPLDQPSVFTRLTVLHLDCSGCYILLQSGLINQSFLENRKFTIFSTCHC